jgi:uncharacterized protein (DUF1684 family)
MHSNERADEPAQATSDPVAEDPRAEKLQLADWRRRIGELYADVRRLAAADPPAAWNRWRLAREWLYREHPSSPVPPDRRPEFVARHFAYDPSLRFELLLQPDEGAAASAVAEGVRNESIGLALPVSLGRPISFDRIGWLEVPFESGARRLALFWLPEYAGGFFLPFRDATNGAGTYGGGRYLIDSSKGADLGGDPARGTVNLDFNFAYHPSCAFDPRWACPLSPPENRLDLGVRAGERLR